MLTIKDIARLANVSVGTVDRVLHNRAGVSKKTEEKVNKILKENNFKLNPIARTLALRVNYNIACIIPEFTEYNEFWKSPISGVKKAGQELQSSGINVSLYNFNQFDVNSYLKEFKKLISTKPNAVIITPIFIEETKELVLELENNNIPYLFLNIEVEGCNNVTFLGQNAYKAGFTAGKLMSLALRSNYECATIVMRQKVKSYNAIPQRIEGFNAYLKTITSRATKKLEMLNLLSTEALRDKVNSFLEENPNIKGVFIPSSRISNIVEVIKEEKIKDLVIIGFDTTDSNVKCLKEDKITYLISQKSFNQGYKSVHVVADLLIHKKVPKQKIYSAIQIIVKENLEYSNSNENSFISE